ncbi:spore cortex-lytic enzyme [Robertmurraya siralis]|uniref:Spore cortex-lytic enzyme n=1 Tax=Robertmurraya siralis TaxID=77777 RepID=A0A919WEY3_9BACI|nr:spore cortex-lytic enzyme [Robertmurraya siralis]GIN60716.1 spore cortex-lytic enzyme [Robertmurraya siralis]
MNKKLLLSKVFLIISICIICVPLSTSEKTVEAFSGQVIQHGAVGDDVIELQSRLQYLGFYNKKIDGVFGWSTYWALRNFQYEFGLPIDGLAGQKTKDMLVRASQYHEQHVKEQINKGNRFTHYGGVDLNKQKGPEKSGGAAKGKGGQKAPAQQQTGQKAPAQQENKGQKTPPQQNQGQNNEAPQANQQPQQPTAANVPNGFSQNDIQLMANAVYGEARGEPYVGQVAVAAVILNRVESATFPNTVSGVIFEPRAFTAVADGQIWLTPNEQARKAVLDAINGWDPTGDAIYYFNPDTATSGWIWTRPQIKRIGKHIFCK